MIRSKHKLLIILLLIPFMAAGQTDEKESLKREEIDVIKPYEPMLADAVKKSFSPTLPELEPERPELRYKHPDRFLNLQYDPVEIRPLAMVKEEQEKLPKLSLTAGYGNRNTPVFEAIYSSSRSDKFIYGGILRHRSSKGDIESQDFSINEGSLFGTLYFNGFSLAQKVKYGREIFHYYGFTEIDTSFTAKQQLYNRAGYNAHIRNTRKNRPGLNYNVDLNYNATHRSRSVFWGGGEHMLNLDGNISKRFTNGDLLNLNVISGYVNNTIKDNNYSGMTISHRESTIFQAIPSYTLSRINLEVGGNFVLNNTSFNFYPELDFHVTVADSLMAFYVKGFGRHKLASVHRHSLENPFTGTKYLFMNHAAYHMEAGIRGNLINDVNYNFKYSYEIHENMPYFINDISDTLAAFKAVYDDTRVQHLQSQLSYNRFEKIRLKLLFNYYVYEMNELEAPWHRSTLKTNLLATYNLGDKFLATADIFAFNERPVKLPSGEVENLEGGVDINFRLRYNYSENISLFAELNNIASMKYQRWYGYPVYGIRALGGINIKL